jgi:quercetin dioxygenase-like cupin family protein
MKYDNGHTLRPDEPPGAPCHRGEMRELGTPAPGVAVFRFRFGDRAPYGPHRHPYHAELVYVAAGSIQQQIEGDALVLRAGGVAVIPRGSLHAAAPLAPGTEVIVVLAGDGDDYRAEEAGSGPAGG